MSFGNLRRHARSDQTAPIRIAWKDSAGVDRMINGTVLDISQSGLRVQLPDPIEARAYVTLHAPRLGLQGSASVRSCERKGMKYIAGLEFSAGLKWKPPSEETGADP
jgi:hypothetical protein